MPLGSLPGHSEAVLDGVGPQKTLKHCLFFEVSVNAQLLALGGHVGVLARMFMGRFWVQIGS